MSHDMREALIDGAQKAAHHVAEPVAQKQLFKAVELRLFRYTAVLSCLAALMTLVALLVWAFGLILGTFYNLLLSLALAGILALVLYPVVQFLEARLHLPRLLAIVLLLVIFFAGLSALLVLLVPTLVGQIVELMTILPERLARWEEHFSFYFPEVRAMIPTNIETDTGETSPSVLKETGHTIISYLGLLAAVSFVPLFLFFALLSGRSLRGQASEVLSIFDRPTQQKILYFLDVFVGYVTAFFRGQLIIAVSMGSLYAISFSLVSLQFGVLLGLVLGLLNIVPFLGTVIGLLVVLPMAYLQPDGGIELLALTGLVFAAVQVVESWLLTPRIMANRSGLHPALVVISLFFWGTALGGIIGMVLAVPLTAFFVAIWSEIKAGLRRTLSSRHART